MSVMDHMRPGQAMLVAAVVVALAAYILLIFEDFLPPD